MRNTVSPITGDRIELVMTTGDNTDNTQLTAVPTPAVAGRTATWSSWSATPMPPRHSDTARGCPPGREPHAGGWPNG